MVQVKSVCDSDIGGPRDVSFYSSTVPYGGTEQVGTTRIHTVPYTYSTAHSAKVQRTRSSRTACDEPGQQVRSSFGAKEI